MTGAAFLDLPVSIGVIVGAAGAFTSVYAVFSKLDEVQSAESRAQVASWLKGAATVRLTKNWASSVVEMFETLFGPKHFTLRCVIASFALTAIVLFCLYLPYFFESAFFHDEICNISRLCKPGDHFVLQGFSRFDGFVVFILTPVVIDYLFLYKTRILFTKVLPRFGSVLMTALLVPLDVALTFICYVVFNVTSDAIVTVADLRFGMLTEILSGAQFATYVRALVQWTSLKDLNPVQVIFLDSVLTSAWLWLYFVLSLAFRAVSSVPYGLTVVSKVIDLTDHPVRSIGFLIAVLAALAVLILTL